MSEVWKADPAVHDTIKALIAKHFPLLAGVDDKILVVFKEKATVAGDVQIPGKTSKASNLLGLVCETDYEFVIQLGADAWVKMTAEQQEALLFHHLCACGAEENPDDGSVRTFVRVPDVSFFRTEVENYGFWRTSGTTPEPDLITELFGDVPDPQAQAAAKEAAKKAKAAARKAAKKGP